IEWGVPGGFQPSEIYWPYPQRIPVGPLAAYGYEGDVMLLSRLTPPSDLPVSRAVTLSAHARWLVCKEQCIPEDAELELTLPTASDGAEDPRWAKPIATARPAGPPAPPAAFAGGAIGGGGEPGGATLMLRPPAGVPLEGVAFFPFEQGKIEPAAAQPFAWADGAFRLKLSAAAQPVGEFTRLAG